MNRTLSRQKSKLDKFGDQAQFIAIVILNHHSNPMKKLKGLYNLFNKGGDATLIRSDVLLINRKHATFIELEVFV